MDIEDFILNTKMQLRYAGIQAPTIHWSGDRLEAFKMYLKEKQIPEDHVRSGMNFMQSTHVFH